MSQDDTYRPAVLPSEAVMMPAMEEAADAPLPAAQEQLPLDDPSMRMAQRSDMSVQLEKLRNRSRVPQNASWMNASNAPLGRSANQPQSPRQGPPPPEGAGSRQAGLGQGSALTTLMRSAARQYRPAPSLATPQPQPQSMPRPAPPLSVAEAPMRGALRQVVRGAQQPQGSAPYMSMPPMGQ